MRAAPLYEAYAGPILSAPQSRHHKQAFSGDVSTDMTAQSPRANEDAAAQIARLRTEHAAQPDRALQALLLHEVGVLEETTGEEMAAVRDYLAAFNADPQFREPLEQLLRILQRRKSIKNLGKLLDALTRASETPEEKARAFWERAAFAQDYETNLATEIGRAHV